MGMGFYRNKWFAIATLAVSILDILLARSALSFEANVFGEDPRTRVIWTDKPWSSIGRLEVPDGSWCTATLVSPDLIVTAAHCLVDLKSLQLMTGNFVFNAGYSEGVARGGTSPAQVEAIGSMDPERNRREDWALLRLSQPLGLSEGWMSVEQTDLTEKIGQPMMYFAGYSRDFEGGTSAAWHGGCQIRKIRKDGAALHDCASAPGASGGAIFYYVQDSHGEWRVNIVGVAVAELRRASDPTATVTGIPYADKFGNVVAPSAAFYSKLIELAEW